jgi:hypothetical protein
MKAVLASYTLSLAVFIPISGWMADRFGTHRDHIYARDGDIGHVQGLLVDDYLWSVRYLIVNTSNWWVAHQVLVSPEWIQGVSWSESKVTIDLDRHAIKDAPAYDEGAPIDRDAELCIYNHYGRNGYWQNPRGRAVA